MGKRKMKSSFEFGWNFAKFYINAGEIEAEPVDIEREVMSSVKIPPDDYYYMKGLGVEIDPREYWRGFNAYVESIKTKKRKNRKPLDAEAEWD